MRRCCRFLGPARTDARRFGGGCLGPIERGIGPAEGAHLIQEKDDHIIGCLRSLLQTDQYLRLFDCGVWVWAVEWQPSLAQPQAAPLQRTPDQTPREIDSAKGKSPGCSAPSIGSRAGLVAVTAISRHASSPGPCRKRSVSSGPWRTDASGVSRPVDGPAVQPIHLAGLWPATDTRYRDHVAGASLHVRRHKVPGRLQPSTGRRSVRARRDAGHGHGWPAVLGVGPPLRLMFVGRASAHPF